MQGQDIGPSIGLESSPGLLHTRAGCHWWDGSRLHPHLLAPSPWAQQPRSGRHWAEQLDRPGAAGLVHGGMWGGSSLPGQGRSLRPPVRPREMPGRPPKAWGGPRSGPKRCDSPNHPRLSQSLPPTRPNPVLPKDAQPRLPGGVCCPGLHCRRKHSSPFGKEALSFPLGLFQNALKPGSGLPGTRTVLFSPVSPPTPTRPHAYIPHFPALSGGSRMEGSPLCPVNPWPETAVFVADS